MLFRCNYSATVLTIHMHGYIWQCALCIYICKAPYVYLNQFHTRLTLLQVYVTQLNTRRAKHALKITILEIAGWHQNNDCFSLKVCLA